MRATFWNRWYLEERTPFRGFTNNLQYLSWKLEWDNSGRASRMSEQVWSYSPMLDTTYTCTVVGNAGKFCRPSYFWIQNQCISGIPCIYKFIIHPFTFRAHKLRIYYIVQNLNILMWMGSIEWSQEKCMTLGRTNIMLTQKYTMLTRKYMMWC